MVAFTRSKGIVGLSWCETHLDTSPSSDFSSAFKREDRTLVDKETVRNSDVNGCPASEKGKPDALNISTLKELSCTEMSVRVDNMKYWRRLNPHQVQSERVVKNDSIRHSNLKGYRLDPHALTWVAFIRNILKNSQCLGRRFPGDSALDEVEHLLSTCMVKMLMHFLQLRGCEQNAFRPE